MKTLDYIAIIVTFTVALILLSTVLGPIITGRALSDEKAQLVSNLISSFIAIIGMYVGAKLRTGNKD